MISTAEEKQSHFSCPGSWLYVIYTVAKKCAVTKTLLKERVIIPVFCVFVGHVHLHHAGPGWEGSPRLRYRAYFIPSHVSFHHAFSFAYGASFSIPSRATYFTEIDDDDFKAPSYISL